MTSQFSRVRSSVRPRDRLRRLRRLPSLRLMFSETRLAISDLIYPIFVDSRITSREPVPSMPGIYRLSLADVPDEIEEVMSLQIPGILVFGLPERKDPIGSEAYSERGIVQRTVEEIRKVAPDFVVATDVCLCQYTDHGHCGVLHGSTVDNDETLKLLAEIAVSHAKAGADLVCPSGMMDGQVKAIRAALDDNLFQDTAIMSYSAKYASSFYGPFREAAESAPFWGLGDRRGYQMNLANRREAMREIEEDITEGADIVMVKPALSYLDVIRDARIQFREPIAAYSTSGEYAMIKAAGAANWLNEKAIALEILTAIKRAGADLTITYFAKEVAKWLQERPDADQAHKT
ncbi:MAG TPA: porphobilinogen synthase [Candidatus Bathyarchaeia archaeon]|nr:porphobilinogen synthase [Candidatus Bathyarchaeia archaeon]